MTTQSDKQEAPERIWIDPNDQSFWNNNGDVRSLIEYARVPSVVATESVLLPVIYKAAKEPCRYYAKGCRAKQPDESYWCAPCSAIKVINARRAAAPIAADPCAVAGFHVCGSKDIELRKAAKRAAEEIAHHLDSTTPLSPGAALIEKIAAIIRETLQR